MRPFQPARAAHPELQHRRRALLGLATLIGLGMSPVVGHHLVGAVEWLPSAAHWGSVCLVALHELMVAVHDVFHALLLAGVGIALADRARALARLHLTLRAIEVRRLHPSEPLARAASAAGLDRERVRAVRDLPHSAFTVGWWRPRVLVSVELPSLLTADELTAVLAHEAAHVSRRDPLRLSLLRFLATMLFWLPALRRLAENLADEAEIVADDAAARTNPLALASAILTIAGNAAARRAPAASVGFHSVDLLDRRIRRLAGEPIAAASHVSRRSLVGAAAALVLVWTSGLMVLRPPPLTLGTTSATHCAHPDESSLSHLYCRVRHLISAQSPCPHAATTSTEPEEWP